MPGRTCFARRGSSRRWTSCRPIASGAAWPWRWRACSREVDVLLVPSLRDEMLTLSNFTGHPSLTLARRIRQRRRGAQRLGARPEEPAAEILAAAARAARRHARRPAVRRRHGRARGARAGAGVRRGRRATAGVLRGVESATGGDEGTGSTRSNEVNEWRRRRIVTRAACGWGSGGRRVQSPGSSSVLEEP